ncbi:NAD(P)/FAD-dependent oxidoreductase [Winogradskya consettensis]|uniref:Pentachlorophenol monooxygenase n=1 Tax=Winogradskya consettensis TaxID=113560 RepID=A0A919VLW1_9ACTN|nr:NAD(P)/FAD-dependent oxidoreductase [Actinoplanes consettensis]GIM68311.1 pentachlorophenol monooxygenase [Actinoplanes consettensis]
MSDGVLIAGAGPVGLTCALALARHGIAVTVLERGDTLSTASRASTFHPGTLDLLEPLGVVPELTAAGRLVSHIQWRDLTGTVLAAMDFAVLQGLTRHPYRLHAEQSTLTRLLAAALLALPGTRLLTGHEVRDVITAPGSVRIRATTRAGTSEFTGRFLVAADGAHSSVRTALGVDFPGEDYPHYALRVITGTPLDEKVPGLAPLAYIRDVRQSFSVLGLRDHWRLIFRIPAGIDAGDAVRPDAVRDLVRRALPQTDVRIDDAHTYRVSRRVLERYRHGTVFFAGDAAHLTSTAGGLNMNCGLHDAADLAETLTALLRGDGNPDEHADRWAERRRAALVGTVLPLSEARARGADGGDPRAAVAEVARTAADPALTRHYLARSSLLPALSATA